MLGGHSYDSLLPDITPARRARRAAEWRAELAAMARIYHTALNRANQVDYAVLQNELH